MYAPPVGPSTPSPESALAVDQAVAACRAVHNASATLRVSMRLGRGHSSSIDVSALVTSAGQIRLMDAKIFVLAGTADRAQLWWRPENRVVTAPTADIVDALVQIKITPQRLLAIMSGCIATSFTPTTLLRIGPQVRADTPDSRLYLGRRDGRWRIVAGEGGGLIVDYPGAFRGDWPAEWRAARADATHTPLILDAVVEDAAFDDPAVGRDPAAFQLQDTPGAVPMSLDDLRAAGIFGKR